MSWSAGIAVLALLAGSEPASASLNPAASAPAATSAADVEGAQNLSNMLMIAALSVAVLSVVLVMSHKKPAAQAAPQAPPPTIDIEAPSPAPADTATTGGGAGGGDHEEGLDARFVSRCRPDASGHELKIAPVLGLRGRMVVAGASVSF